MKPPTLESLTREFFAILDQVDESDSGRRFNPVFISSCRALTTSKLTEILSEMRRLSNPDPQQT